MLITEDMRRIPATVYDVSNLGMRVETDEELPLGLALSVEVQGFDAPGIVRHCIGRNGKYEVGVHLMSSHRDAAAPSPGTGAETP